MTKEINSDTRYFIDVDLKSKKVIRSDYDDRNLLSEERLPENVVRIYITKGQFNKLIKIKDKNE